TPLWRGVRLRDGGYPCSAHCSGLGFGRGFPSRARGRKRRDEISVVFFDSCFSSSSLDEFRGPNSKSTSPNSRVSLLALYGPARPCFCPSCRPKSRGTTRS